MTSLAAFLLIQILGTTLCAQDWATEEGIDGILGPKEWGQKYGDCKKPNQSPVNIVKEKAEKAENLKDFGYSSFRKHFTNVSVTNNGSYLVLESDDMESVSLHRGDFSSYKLKEIRFHWGPNDSVGSENMFDGKRYPLEMLLVSYDETLFDTLRESMDEGYGLAIVAVVYQIASEDNEKISDVVDALEHIHEVGQTKIIPKMKSSLQHLLPDERRSFYVFEGTLTTPPCTSALWSIYINPQTISSSQLEKFRQLNAQFGGKLTNTDRPIQPLGDRTIYYNTYKFNSYK